jgi:transcriptional antiterminator RfaH
MDGQLCWYAVRTKTWQEARAESHLNAWQVETYLPRIIESVRNAFSGQASLIIKPLFSRYLFARFRAGEVLHKVHYTRGVASVVGCGMWPTPVDDEIIALLKSQNGPDGYFRLSGELKAGDRVRIVNGPLKNFVGILEGTANERERVSILLTAVSFQSRVLIERHMVKKVATAN